MQAIQIDSIFFIDLSQFLTQGVNVVTEPIGVAKNLNISNGAICNVKT
jgi:hypothetical protein